MSLFQFFIFFIGGLLWCFIDELSFKNFERKYSKKSDYNCFKCKAWSCRSKTCIEKRKHLLDKKEVK